MVDLDAVGGAATGGLIASTFERPTGEAGEAHGVCADCGTEVIGRFCHNCGNPAHVHRTLLHLGEELLHGVMHFDSRTWRTLPLLLVRPGRLTREWVMGKRSRYVSPLALFLFTVFVMFMAISYAPPSAKRPLAEQKVVAAAELARKNTALANARAAVGKATTEEARNEALANVREAEGDVREARDDVQGLSVSVDALNWKDSLAKDVETGKTKFNTGNKELDKKLTEKAENPELALYKLQQAFYKFSFLLVPISIPFVALLFLWKKGFTLYDHGVFVLYSLTFMSLVVMVVAAATRIGGIVGGVAWATAPFIIPAHMFCQLQGAYGLKWFSTLWRTWFLLWFSLFALLLFIAAILWFEAKV